MLRAILVDDEPLALRRLEIALAGIDSCEIVGKASDGDQAGKLIAELKPDVIFVDIQMPGMTGLELVESLEGERPPVVIFVTAFEQFALDAFDSGAVDYVLKPIDDERLAKAITRAQTSRMSFDAEEQIIDLRKAVELLRNNRDDRADSQFLDDIWISGRGTSYRVPVRDIRMFEAAGDYVQLHTAEREHLHYDSLRSLEERLDPDRFMRVHRSAIVALPFVESVERASYGRLTLHLDNGKKARCSRAARGAVQERLVQGGG